MSSQAAQAILKKAAKYQRVSPFGNDPLALHLRNPYFLKPEVIKGPAPQEFKPDDTTNFPKQKIVIMPETIPYMEGAYMPPSNPFTAGFYSYSMYLQAGVVYNFCACGLSQMNAPWCDGMCNSVSTRLRPIQFNVNESGYYKINNDKQSANAPFCNGSNLTLIKSYAEGWRGRYELYGFAFYWATWGYFFWNYYT